MDGTTTETEIPYTERELIQRVLRHAFRSAKCGTPRWITVKRYFSVGSETAKLICFKYGFDPHKEATIQAQLSEDQYLENLAQHGAI